MPGLRIRVPATCANLGPGFDCLGLALDLYNDTWLEWDGVASYAVEIEGEGASDLPRDETHLTLRALVEGMQALDQPIRPVRLRQVNRIPLSRGMGSSAAAIVAGLVAARAMAGARENPAWVLQHAAAMEGHPDNVAAATCGGVTAAWVEEERAFCLPLGYPRDLHVALAVPAFRVSTEEARQALPRLVPLEDVTFTLSRCAVLVGALASGRLDLVGEAVRDRLHTPYRAALIPGIAEVEAAARAAGAVGFFISGSGPTVAAFATDAREAETAAEAMARAFQRQGTAAAAHAVPVAARGAWAEALE